MRAGEQGPWDRAGEHDFRGEPTQADGGEAAGAQREAPPEQRPARVILESKPASFKVRRRAGPAHAKSAAVKPASFARTRTSPFSRVARASRLAFHAAQRHLVEQYVPVARFGVNSRSQNAQCMPNTSFPFQRILGRQTARWGHSHERPRGVSAAIGGRVARCRPIGRSRYPRASSGPRRFPVARGQDSERPWTLRSIACEGPRHQVPSWRCSHMSCFIHNAPT